MKKPHISSVSFVALTAVAGLLLSCTNKATEENTPAPAPAKITYTTPAEGTVFMHGDTVHIMGEIVTAEQMHGYSISIINKAGQASLYRQEEHFHGKSTPFHHSWVNTLTDSAELEIEVAVTLDHDGNIAARKRGIKCQ